MQICILKNAQIDKFQAEMPEMTLDSLPEEFLFGFVDQIFE
jgi:hypothetical protein